MDEEAGISATERIVIQQHLQSLSPSTNQLAARETNPKVISPYLLEQVEMDRYSITKGNVVQSILFCFRVRLFFLCGQPAAAERKHLGSSRLVIVKHVARIA